jgi:hypothetical protein
MDDEPRRKIRKAVWKDTGRASSLKAHDSRLRQLVTHVNIDDPEAVKACVASRDTTRLLL